MKHWINKKISFLVLGLFSSFYLLAQDDKKLDIDIDVNKGDKDIWYQQPWAWAIGAAIFVLLMIALLRGRGKRE